MKSSDQALTKALILVCDDDASLREVVRLTLELDGFDVVESSSLTEAKTVLEKCRPSLALMDINMPGPDGSVVTQELLRLHPDLRVIAYTGQNNPDSVMNMLAAGAVGYLIKGATLSHLGGMIRECLAGGIVVDPEVQQTLWRAAVEALQYEHHARERAQDLAQELQESYEEIVLSLVEALRTRDQETQGHVDRVVNLTVMLAKECGGDETTIERARYGALFHDIGKLGVPDSILFGEGELTEDGWKIIKEHTIIGERILKPIHHLSNVARIVRSTHENWDGSGYPDGLKHSEIPLESRIIRVADSFDAMSSRRRYQNQQNLSEAVETIKGLAGVNFDPEVAEALTRLWEKGMLPSFEGVE